MEISLETGVQVQSVPVNMIVGDKFSLETGVQVQGVLVNMILGD